MIVSFTSLPNSKTFVGNPLSKGYWGILAEQDLSILYGVESGLYPVEVWQGVR